MIITNSAKEKISQFIENDEYCRIEIKSGGCNGFSYNFFVDKKMEDDILVNNIILDPSSYEILKNAIIDYKIDLTGQSFKITIPEAKSQCGCGTSFSL